MAHKFTTQDVIDMAADLYDNKGFTRGDIRIFLTVLQNHGQWDSTTADIDNVFDLVVG